MIYSPTGSFIGCFADTANSLSNLTRYETWYTITSTVLYKLYALSEKTLVLPTFVFSVCFFTLIIKDTNKIGRRGKQATYTVIIVTNDNYLKQKKQNLISRYYHNIRFNCVLERGVAQWLERGMSLPVVRFRAPLGAEFS